LTPINSVFILLALAHEYQKLGVLSNFTHDFSSFQEEKLGRSGIFFGQNGENFLESCLRSGQILNKPR
jgi:hypothetical protein